MKSERYFRSLSSGWIGFKVRIISVKTEQCSRYIVRKQIDARVIALNRLIISPPRLRNSIFGARELMLQVHEVLIRSQLRIIFREYEQPADRAVETRICRDALLRVAGVQ